MQEESDLVLAKLAKNHQFNLEEQQRNSWIKEIEILKKVLKDLSSGWILFEYSIPRMGKRTDVILILNGLIFVIEFKINENQYISYDIDQCFDYVLDLKYFHEQSQNIKIIPILVATDGVDFTNTFEQYDDGVLKPIKCNKYNLNKTILTVSERFGGNDIDPIKWEKSNYKPTPTIIEAAQALYQGHSVKEISRSDSGAENLTKTADAINNIIEKSKKEKIKSICFVTPQSSKSDPITKMHTHYSRYYFYLAVELEDDIALAGKRAGAAALFVNPE